MIKLVNTFAILPQLDQILSPEKFVQINNNIDGNFKNKNGPNLITFLKYIN